MSSLAPRARAVAIWFVAMLALSAVPAVVPTASATADGAVDKTIATIDTVAASNTTIAHIGSALHVEAFVNDTSTLGVGDACGTAVTTPATHTKTVFIDNGTGRVLGLPDGSTLTDSGDANFYRGDFTIAQAMGGATNLNGVIVPLRVNITVTCAVASQGQASSFKTVTSNNTVYFQLDNQPPTATATYECSPACGIGDLFWLNLTGASPDMAASGNTADLSGIGGLAAQSIATSGPNGPFTIAKTASTSPVVITLHDIHNNVATITATGGTIDTVAPAAIVINSVTAVTGSDLLIDITASTDTGVGAMAYYLNESPANSNALRSLQLNATGALTQDSSSSGTHIVLRLKPAPGFDSGLQNLSIFVKDTVGNPSIASNTTGTPLANPASVTIAAKPAAGNAFVSPYGSFTTANPISAGSTTLKLWLSRDTAGSPEYWTGDDPTLATSWKSTKQTFPLGNTDSSVGTFNGAVLNASTPGTGVNAAALAERTYRIGVDFMASGTVIANDSYAFLYDKSKPVLAASAGGINNFGSNVASGVPQASSIRFAVNATDQDANGAPLSGVASVSVQMLSSATGNPAVNDLFGNPAVMTCGATLANGCMYGNVPGSTSTNFASNLTLQLPAVAFGSYVLQTTVTDAAGNFVTSPVSLPFTVVPRVRLLDPAGTPFYTGSGVEAFVYGGYTAPSALDSGASCKVTSNVCPVTALELYGRTSSTTGSTPGSTGVVLLWNSLTPRSPTPGPVVFNGTTFDTLGFYNYSNLSGQPYPLKGLNPLSMQLMALSRVTVGSSQFVGMSPWTPVKLNAAAPLLNFAMPNDNTFVFMDTVNGTASFNVTFDKSGLDSLPTLDYVVTNVSSGASITFNSSGQQAIAPLGQVGQRYYYNFSNVGQLPRGKFVLTAYVNGSAQSVPVAAVATRLFAVEDQEPVLSFEVPQASIFHGVYVPHVFNLAYSLKTGFAKVTNLSRFNVTLTSPNQNSAGTFTLTNTSSPTPAGYHFWLNGTVFDPSNTTSYGNITIKLPDNASDGSQYFIKVSVQTDSVTMGGGDATPPAGRNPVSKVTNQWFVNATAQQPVYVDVMPAAAGVYTQQTNDTGNSDELRIIGFATDYGSGVRAVKARIIDLNTTPPSTFDVNANGGAGGFVPGVTNSWVGSDPVTLTNRTGGGTVTDITLSNTSDPAVDQWVIRTGVLRSVVGSTVPTMPTTLPSILLDHNHTYEIDVAAVDNINDYPAPATYTVAFDTTPPVFDPNGAFTGSTSVGWHGGGSLSVSASDNWCMLRVSLTGTTPSGLPVPRADFTPTNAAAACGRPNAAVPQSWTLDLAQFPNVTDEVGAYNLLVDAVDAAGHVTHGTQNLTLTVVDSQPAVVRFLTLVPPVAPTGGRSIVRAEVFENHKVLNVNATLARLLPGGSVDTASATHASHQPTSSQAANGTGIYEFWSDTDMQQNLTVGDYLWTIQADDDNSVARTTTSTYCIDTRTPDQICPKTSKIVRVADSTTPFIQQDLPAAGVAFVNASPTFHWRVLGANITQSGLTLLSGPVNGTLSTASPAATINALAPVGNTATGYDVTFGPGSLASVTNISVQLTATNANGLTAMSWTNYTVDAKAPNVNATASNTVTIGGRTYATSSTRITLNATDNETSIAALTYRVNGGTSLTYATPFAVAGPDGAWQVDYVATDLAGNAASGTISLNVDATPPTISLARGGDSILLTVSDAGVGVDDGNVTVHYAYGTAPTFTVMKATKVAGNSYQAQLPGNATATGLRYYFDAKDLLGNLGALNGSASPIVIRKDQPPPDLPPQLTITAPTNGSEWRGGVDLKWIAVDPEGQNVTIAIALREPVGTGSFLVTNGDNTGLYHVDLTNKPSGSYTLVVTATDGVQSAQQTVTFTVPTQRPAYECLACPPANVTANMAINFGFGLNPIGTTVASATFNVTRDGVVVSTGILKLQNGVWTMTYTPTAPGKYKIFVTEVDATGIVQPAHEVGSFEVQGAAPQTPVTGGGVPPSFLVLIVLGILTIALAAYGAFVRWK